MDWNRLRRFLSPGRTNDSKTADVTWIEAADSPWGVRVLDVRPVTLTALAFSTDRRCAENAMSFRLDDGSSFVGKPPAVSRIIKASLTFPIDRVLVDGVLFIPREMEHKWAIFYYRGDVICVRSWQRTVGVVAHVELHRDHAEVTQVRGTFTAEDEDPDLTVRLFDWLLRTHALGTVYPVPLPPEMESDPAAAASWCMSLFGNRALFATPHDFERRDPDRPLRTHSLLHIAVARRQISEIEARLSAGVPVDLLAGDGLAPLHWALVHQDTSIMALLLERGSSVDVRSGEGATPLMTAVQSASLDKVRFLLDRGADVNARDRRGFTSLHRSVELGHVELTQELLDHGAAPSIEAEGQTARSLAERHQNQRILALLDRNRGGAS